MLTKKCNVCEIEKPLSDFSKDKKRKLGVNLTCKACYNPLQRERRAKKRDELRAYYAEYRAKHRVEQNQRALGYYYQNKERHKARQDKYNQSHQAQIKERADRWRRENKERIRQRNKEYGKAHREAKQVSLLQYRARKSANGGSFTLEEWRNLCTHYGNICLRCGESKPLHADHIIPISKGGTSNIDNIQPLCGSCNQSKNDKTIDYRPDSGSHIPKQLTLW